jgi:hypothetical protein
MTDDQEPSVGLPNDEMDPEERAWQSWVSPHYRRSDFPALGPTEEQEILIFADRVWGWQIDVAMRLLETDKHADYAALAILMSYFEMIGKHLQGFEGEGASRKHFVIGFGDVFADRPPQETARIAERIYEAVRCGLYHDSITSHGIAIAGRDDAHVIKEQPDADGNVEITINPGGLLDWVRLHFAGYVGELLSEAGTEKRELFHRRFRNVHGSASGEGAGAAET